MTADVAPASAPHLDDLGEALRHRALAVAAAVRRLDGFDARGGGPPVSEPDRDDIREFVLRALRAAGDRDNDLILRAVAAGVSDASALATRTSRGRLGLWEAVSDLVQVGLLERDAVADRVHVTAAGHAVLALVDAVVGVGVTT